MEHQYEVGQRVRVAYLQAADVKGYNREGVIKKLMPFGEYTVDLVGGRNKVTDLLVSNDDIAPLEEK